RRYSALWIGLVGLLMALGCQTREIGAGATGAGLTTGGELVFSDDFDRDSLGDDWKRGTGEGGPGQWTLEDGSVKGERLRNDPLWLQTPLPEKVRVEFEAEALTEVGDIKVEIFGDGEHHESGYVLIFGGWNNSLDVMARRDEHGDDRKERQSRKVTPEKNYKMAIERTDDSVRWYVDGELFMSYEDKAALRGDEHRYFGFSNWDAQVRFRNVRVYDLSKRG
ncbi:MAG: hypothetical protein ACNA8W_11900, partial [Bradymonadaceae bacterium]